MAALDDTSHFGPAALAAGLCALGYAVKTGSMAPQFQGHHLLRMRYRIRFGTRAGEHCSVAFIAPLDWPASSPAGIYVFPALRPLDQTAVLPHGGVTDATQIFGEQGWQYWSRPHDAWAQSERSAKAWMAHVDRLFIHV